MATALAFINPSITTRNVGDLFIEDSVKRILKYDRQASVDIDPRRPIGAAEIERINACDAAVIVGTNLWYRDMPRPGRWCFTAGQLEQIRVPIIPLGMGTTRHEGEDNAFEPETLRQLRLIHERCALGGVRDLRTLEALAEAGLRNVEMTGCPTLFRGLAPTWRLNGSKPTRRVAVTVRKGQRENVRRLIVLLKRRGFEPVVAAQQAKDCFLRGRIPLLRAFRDKTPVLYQYDLRPYLDLVEQSIGAIGWRLHGDMFHLAHGNPAMFFANCSRAESFCQSFALPYVYVPDGRLLSEAQLAAGVDRFLDPASFTRFAERYSHYFARMAAFLAANGLAHHLSQRTDAEDDRSAA